MTTVRTIFRKLLGHRQEAGTAAIEFGILAPLLALVLVGMVDLSSVMYQAMQLNSAVEAGTFYVLRNGWSSSTGAAPIVAAVQKTGMISGTPTAICVYGCPIAGVGIASQAGTCGSGSSTLTCSNGYAPGQYVRINAQLSTTTLIASGIFGFFGGSLALPDPLTATSTIRLP
ncbi:MAG: TadE/TadG family type IV pilus assembly protein [Tardiphaga sp.]